MKQMLSSYSITSIFFITALVWILIPFISVQASPATNQALIKASSVGDVTKVQALLAKDAEVNRQAKNDWPALIWASSGGHEAVVKVLLEKGANVNIKSLNGITALSLATNKGIVQLLKAAEAK